MVATFIAESRETLTLSPFDLVHSENSFDFPPSILPLSVFAWVDPMLALKRENSNIPFMRLRIREEVLEVIEEMVKSDAQFDVTAFEKEVVDMIVLILSLAVSCEESFFEELDLVSISQRLNGRGRRDFIFDQMMEAAGNIEASTLRKDIENIMALWFSYVRHAPIAHSVHHVMQSVIRKNMGNHPAMFYSGKDVQTQEVLNPDESRLQFFHAKAAMRLIRVWAGNPPNGLRPQHYLPFAYYVLDFRNSQQRLAELASLLSVTDPRLCQYLEATRSQQIMSWRSAEVEAVSMRRNVQ